jgi:hypothetical protein
MPSPRYTVRLPPALDARVQARVRADSPADRAPTPAAPPAAPRHPGRPSGPMRQQILAALQAHPGGLRAEELRVHIQARRPIGDTLQGMLKAGVIVAQGRGPQRRYVAGAIPP